MYGRIVDFPSPAVKHEILSLREISKDTRLSVWTLNSSEALSVHEDNAKEITDRFGGVFVPSN